MATTTLPTTSQVLTWEEFERLPDGDGFHRELLEEELQILPPAKSGHTLVAKRVYATLLALEKMGAGTALQEAGYKLAAAKKTWIQPDVSFLAGDRARTVPADEYFPGAPELAVEVISPTESAKDVEHKTRLMLAHGAKAVWVVYPTSRSVHVFTPDGLAAVKGVGDTLTAPYLHPEWVVAVKAIFED